MGHIRHHAILVTVTTHHNEHLKAHEKAMELFRSDSDDEVAPVSPLAISDVNRYATFVVCPDGFKESWELSKRGDEARDQFIAWLNEQRFSDGSTPFAWAEVQYGDDDEDNRVTRHTDQPEFKRPGVLTF